MERPYQERCAQGAPTVPAIALDVESAAAALSISPRTLKELVARGEVPSFRIGRRRLFPVEALQEWLRQMVGGVGVPLCYDKVDAEDGEGAQ